VWRVGQTSPVHVVIVGGGEVGWYLAERLRAESHDVVLVEMDDRVARAIAESLDVQVVVGNACHPSVLIEAGIERASLLAGVTQSDEVNLITSLLAKQFGVERTVVRIQTDELYGESGRRLLSAVSADVVMDPDYDTAKEILELVHLSGADEVYAMVEGQLVVLGATIRSGAAVAGQTLRDIGAALDTGREFLFGAVTRRGETVIPHGDEVLEVGDHVRVLTTRAARRSTLELLGATNQQAHRMMVLGGGSVGSRVAREMTAEGVEVVLVERDLAIAERLAATMPHARILHGDVTDMDLLREASIATMDVVVATTGEDTANVLACAFAVAEGPAFTVAVIHRLALLPLVGQFGIGATVSPRTASANAVLRELRGRLGSVTTFLESDVEANELEVKAGSRADGARISDMGVPLRVLLGAVVRKDGQVELTSGATRLIAGDRVVVFSRPADLRRAQRLFQP
jgi:trk system potassium uptake protein